MNRRESFELAYAKAHDLPIETFSQYRMGDTYRLPGIASHWRTWNSAMDVVCIGRFEGDEGHREYLAAVMPLKRSNARHIAYYLEDNPEVRIEVEAELKYMDEDPEEVMI